MFSDSNDELISCTPPDLKEAADKIEESLLPTKSTTKACTNQKELKDKNNPNFEYNVPRNVTTTVGHTAFLQCQVEQLGDKAVSWIRKRDLHILTVGILTYTSDQRFQVIRSEKSCNWTLQIKFPQVRDSGIYECQVNTEPKISLPFKLNVVEPRARILESTELHVKEGSSVTLTCTINQGPHDLNTVFWYKGNAKLPPVEHFRRINIQNYWAEVLTSRLHINNVNWSDSGKYSCVPTSAALAYVNLYVIQGERPAAMQHSNTSRASSILLSNYCGPWCLAIIIISQCR